MVHIGSIIGNKNENTELSTDILSDVFKAFQGDVIAKGRIIYTLFQMPFYIRDRIFWSKIEQFLNGVYLNENDCSDLRAKLAEYDKEEENIYRLISYIDRAETNEMIVKKLIMDFLYTKVTFAEGE